MEIFNMMHIEGRDEMKSEVFAIMPGKSEHGTGNGPRWKKLWAQIKLHRFRYLLLLPGLIFFIIYKYIPMYGIIIAFKKYNFMKGIWKSPWIGLQNFDTLFRYGDFQRAFINTIVISVMKICVIYFFTIITALLLNELKDGLFKRGVQTISYMPHFLSWVAIYGIFVNILSPESGSFIRLLISLGLPKIDFFTDPIVFRITLVFSELWKSLGWNTIIYLAALSGIDPELYEAAYMDGANRFRRMLHVSLPGILPIIVIMLILNTGKIMDENLQQILQFSNPLVTQVSDVFETIVYRKGIQEANYSYATAVGLFKSSVSLILTLFVNQVAKKAGQEGLW